MTQLQKDFYFLSPVEAVKVTSQNLEEVAEWCGGKVASTESRRVPGRQDSYVWVPTPKGTSISWAFPGMLITKRLVRTVKDDMRITYAVFRKDYFEKNYFESPSDAVKQTWEQGNKKKPRPPKGSIPHQAVQAEPTQNVTINVQAPDQATAEKVASEVVKSLDEAKGVLQGKQMPVEAAYTGEPKVTMPSPADIRELKREHTVEEEVKMDAAERRAAVEMSVASGDPEPTPNGTADVTITE